MRLNDIMGPLVPSFISEEGELLLKMEHIISPH